MAVKINKISVHKIRPSESQIDFGAEIRGADLENLSGELTFFYHAKTRANLII